MSDGQKTYLTTDELAERIKYDTDVIPMGYVSQSQLHQIARPQFAIQGQIEHG